MKRYKTQEVKDNVSQMLYDSQPALITNRKTPAAYVIPISYLDMSGNLLLKQMLERLRDEASPQ